MTAQPKANYQPASSVSASPQLLREIMAWPLWAQPLLNDPPVIKGPVGDDWDRFCNLDGQATHTQRLLPTLHFLTLLQADAPLATRRQSLHLILIKNSHHLLLSLTAQDSGGNSLLPKCISDKILFCPLLSSPMTLACYFSSPNLFPQLLEGNEQNLVPAGVVEETQHYLSKWLGQYLEHSMKWMTTSIFKIYLWLPSLSLSRLGYSCDHCILVIS